jgi:hypothetical protein
MGLAPDHRFGRGTGGDRPAASGPPDSKLRWIGLVVAVMFAASRTESETKLTSHLENKILEKKEQGGSPARKIVSTLFPRMFGFILD